MAPSLGSVAVGFVVVGAVLWPLERWRPGVAMQPLWRPDTPTDLSYWFFTPLVGGAVRRLAVAFVVVLLALCAGVALDRGAVEAYFARDALVRHQPQSMQVLEVLVIGDLVGYGMHRLLHGRRLWRFHAVHHSSTQVDWVASVRVHPVNDVLARVPQVAVILLLGYPPTIVAAYVPVLTLWALVLHANVPWDLGPLRWVIASPAFHRWHHSRESEAQGRNLAGLFPFVDALFGTLHVPRDRRPTAFGIPGDPVPAGLWAQIRYPFTAAARRPGRATRVVLATSMAFLFASASAAVAATATQRCASAKTRAAGKAASCLLSLDARSTGGALVDPGKLERCRTRLGDPSKGAFARAEARGGCIASGDAPAVESRIDAFADGVHATLAIDVPNACQAAKLRAAARDVDCSLAQMAKAAGGRGPDPARMQSCKDRLGGSGGAFAAAEERGGCGTVGDAGAIQATIDAFVDDVVGAEPSSSTCATAGCPAPVACDPAMGPCWSPPVDARWQYQLQAARTPSGGCGFAATGGIDVGLAATPFGGGTPVGPAVLDFDFLVDDVCAPGGSHDVDNVVAVAAVHASGARAICYVDAGTDEPFRPDHQAYVDFDAACGGCLLGRSVSGFRDERWLDVNDDRGQRTFVLGALGARVDRCRADGFDAVEFDNVDGYANTTGFSISDATQLVFNASLANLAHAKGLAVALKNDVEQIPELLPYFDMAVNEQCAQFGECATLDPFVAASKPVFQVEYQVAAGAACPPANAAGRNAIVKTVELFDTPWTPCR